MILLEVLLLLVLLRWLNSVYSHRYVDSMSVPTCPSIFCPLTASAEKSLLDFTATVK